MSILPAAILTAIAVPALGNPAMQSASTKPSKARPKVAVFTFSGGYKHDVLELAEKTIAQLTKKHDDFEVVLHHQYRQEAGKLDLSMINADYLKQFAGILFYTTSGEKDKDLLTAEQRKALMDAIKGGTGFIGIHSAADTFYKWPEYGEMIGAYFDGHPWNADSPPVTLKVEDNEHPAGNPIGSFWFLQEEIYQFRAPYDRKKLHVLLSLDTDATDMTVPGIIKDVFEDAGIRGFCGRLVKISRQGPRVLHRAGASRRRLGERAVPEPPARRNSLGHRAAERQSPVAGRRARAVDYDRERPEI